MPIYEYECPKCGRFELTQRITDAPRQRCGKCGTRIQRLISATSFTLKGSGWYATDYGSGGSTSGTKSPSGGSPKAGKGGGPTSKGSATPAAA